MSTPNMTYINFAYVELIGDWNLVSEDVHEDMDIYEAREEDAAINVRIFDEKKTSYYLKKGAKIIIRNNILKFNKMDFSQ